MLFNKTIIYVGQAEKALGKNLRFLFISTVVKLFATWSLRTILNLNMKP